MKKKNAIEKSEYINKRYREYLKSSFAFENEFLQEIFYEQLDKEELFKGPYVDLNLPFKRGKSIDELIEQGYICESFKKLDDILFERPLYSHQEEAIKILNEGRSAIITTGTGSGKTESFLYPILNDILRDIEKGNSEIGIRAILLYPMNALVNDQMDRVRKLLRHCPEITYGFFTGDTEEHMSSKDREDYAKENGVEIPANEIITREEIRKNPPHILFTNYSMLEYLLIRPNDYAIFNEDRLNNWKYIVMDEAHSYGGALGIELSLLMKRLTGMAHKKPRFILTSATLGQQGKSESDIIAFAKNLTSVEFGIEDIVFSKRIPMSKNILEYAVDARDYMEINDSLNDSSKLISIVNKYLICKEVDVKECLYELLIRDKNVYKMYKILMEGCKDFNKLKTDMAIDISKDELSALIDIINIAEKNGVGIFDLKYHSFIRPLSGAYISLENIPQLSLKKTNYINGLKAFEVGNCRYCNTPYIIGKKIINIVKGLEYLVQNNEIDIYENYGENENIKLDYYLLEDSVCEEGIERNNLEKYVVCAKCGEIHFADNLNAKSCECESSYKREIYRVVSVAKDDEFQAYNNINSCPCCGHRSKSGIVRALNVGKDEGTAIVAQMLYNAIDSSEIMPQKTTKLSLKKKKEKKVDIVPEDTKQFLTFSDSRQQASFTAVFFDATNIRMLKKRLIWNVIENNNFKDIRVDELASMLISDIKYYNLFNDSTVDVNERKLSTTKNAWATILTDLLKVDGSYDGEGLGLYYFDLDLSDILSEFDDDDVAESFGEYGIHTIDELAVLMQVVFGIFQTTPAVNYVRKSTLLPEERKKLLGYQWYDFYVMYQSPKVLKGIKSFLPVSTKDNYVVRYIMKVCGCDVSSAKEILDVLFNQLAVPVGNMSGNEPFFIKNGQKDAYQIDVSRYILKNYKTSKYYQCSQCGRLTPYNLHNKCVQDKCEGTLVEIDPDVVLANNYYRNEYKTRKIESIIIKEHTAQISKSKAKKYQNAFKNKTINILSCSTTFEMGIDLGTLETVFMRNVPPTPANYVQRAGRAGRGKDSTAYILTYCSVSSHDYTYFEEPEKMIRGVINPPSFNVLNSKIIIRHLMASSLGFFFRKYPDYANKIELLVFGDGVEKFNSFLSSHPKELNDYINNKVIPEKKYIDFRDFKWFDSMRGDDKLQRFVDNIRQIAKDYEQARNDAIREENYRQADYYKIQIEKLRDMRVIDSLSRYCVIPKYGFPVDVVNLDVYEKGVKNSSLNLNRDLRIAISEYAPDSEVIADGNKYTSGFISLPKKGDLPKRFFSTCSSCKKINVNYSDINRKCVHCGYDLSTVNIESFLQPVEGFKTIPTKTSAYYKPKKSYAGEVTYVGNGELDEHKLELGNVLSVETSFDDELMIVNKSGFYMCPKCGYSEIHKGGITTSERVKRHMNYKDFLCDNDELQLIRIGHTFKTDVARITIPQLRASADREDVSRGLSFLYAFLEGICETMDIERSDIDGIIEMNFDYGSYDVLIYDNVPGGAGHVKRLLDKQAIIQSLDNARIKMSYMCCDEETSCYYCLRNYYNQLYHNKLKKRLAREFLEELVRSLQSVK